MSSDLLNRIEELRRSLDVLPRESGETADVTLKNVLFGAQFEWADDVTEFPKTEDQEREFIRRRDEAFAAFKPDVTLSRLAGWERDAEELFEAKTPGAALQQFSAIDVPLSDTEEVVGENVVEYERHIDAEIEHRLLSR